MEHVLVSSLLVSLSVQCVWVFLSNGLKFPADKWQPIMKLQHNNSMADVLMTISLFQNKSI